MELVLIFGPPAVGKMTVGRELARRTGFKLFHNHMTVEPLLEIFPFGSPPFERLVDEFRGRVIEEAAESGLPGLVFTFVWAVNHPGDRTLVERYVEIVESRGGAVRFVELSAPLSVRRDRNLTPLRLEHKRSKRDLDASDGWLLDAERDWTLNTDSDAALAQLVGGRPALRIDNTELDPGEVADQVVRAFDLAVADAPR